VFVEGGEAIGNASGPISIGALATASVAKLNGYNPVGTTAAASVGTSPATICAGPSPETHYLTQSATNTAMVTINSQQVAALKTAGEFYTIQLESKECYIVTWATTQPTYTKDVH
jgi:hypothetical protein